METSDPLCPYSWLLFQRVADGFPHLGFTRYCCVMDLKVDIKFWLWKSLDLDHDMTSTSFLKTPLLKKVFVLGFRLCVSFYSIWGRVLLLLVVSRKGMHTLGCFYECVSYDKTLTEGFVKCFPSKLDLYLRFWLNENHRKIVVGKKVLFGKQQEKKKVLFSIHEWLFQQRVLV